MKVVKEKLIDAICESVIAANGETLLEQEKKKVDFVDDASIDKVISNIKAFNQQAGASTAQTKKTEEPPEEDAADEDTAPATVSLESISDFQTAITRKVGEAGNKLEIIGNIAKSGYGYATGVASDTSKHTQEGFNKYTNKFLIGLDQNIFYYNMMKDIKNIVENKTNFIKQYEKVFGPRFTADYIGGEDEDAIEFEVEDGKVKTKGGKKVDEQKAGEEGEETLPRRPDFAALGGRRTVQRKFLNKLLPQLHQRKVTYLNPKTFDEDSLAKLIGLEDPEEGQSKKLDTIKTEAETNPSKARRDNETYMKDVIDKYNEIVQSIHAGFADSLDGETKRVKDRIKYIEENLLGDSKPGEENKNLDRDDMEYIPFMIDPEWDRWTSILQVEAASPDGNINVTTVMDDLVKLMSLTPMLWGLNRKAAYAYAMRDAKQVDIVDGKTILRYETPERQAQAEKDAEDIHTYAAATLILINTMRQFSKGREDVKGAFTALAKPPSGFLRSITSAKYQDDVDKMVIDGDKIKNVKVKAKGRVSLSTRKLLASWLGSNQPWIIPGGGKGILSEVLMKLLLSILDPTVGLIGIVSRLAGYTVGLAEVNSTLQNQKKAIKKYEEVLGKLKKFDIEQFDDGEIGREALEELRILKGEIEKIYSDSIEIDRILKEKGMTREIVEETPESLASRIRRALLSEEAQETIFDAVEDPVNNPTGPIDAADDTLRANAEKGEQALNGLERADTERKAAAKAAADVEDAFSKATGINKVQKQTDPKTGKKKTPDRKPGERVKFPPFGKKGKGPKPKPTPTTTKMPDLDMSTDKRDDDFGIFEQKQNIANMSGDLNFGQMKKDFSIEYDQAFEERKKYSSNLLLLYTYTYMKGLQNVGAYSQYAVNLGMYTNLYIDVLSSYISTFASEAPEPEEQADVDVDGSDQPITIKGKVPPQAPVKERVIRVSKNKLIDIIFEHLEEQKQTIDISKDQLVALVAQEAFKQINRKK
jgi:hypothetical protein